ASASARRAASEARSLVAWSAAAMRRSLMPVRVVIHSSEVSTIFERSSLVRTFSGMKLPVPMMLEAQKGCWLGVGMDEEVLGDGGLDVRVDLLGDGVAGHADGVFHGVGAGAAVGDDGDAVETEQGHAA